MWYSLLIDQPSYALRKRTVTKNAEIERILHQSYSHGDVFWLVKFHTQEQTFILLHRYRRYNILSPTRWRLNSRRYNDVNIARPCITIIFESRVLTTRLNVATRLAKTAHSREERGQTKSTFTISHCSFSAAFEVMCACIRFCCHFVSFSARTMKPPTTVTPYPLPQIW